MKRCLPLAFALLSVAAESQSQGLKYSGSPAERYTASKDKIVGDIIVDAQQGVAWMRCPVNTEFESTQGKCVGEPALQTFGEATAFAKRIGGGWRLPTFQESALSGLHLIKTLSGGQVLKTFGDGSTDFACDAQSIWTSTGIAGNPGSVALAYCTNQFMGGSQIVAREALREGGSPASYARNGRTQILLVKSIAK